MTTHVLIGSANDLTPALYIIGLTKVPFRGGGAFWNVGRVHLPLSHTHTPAQIFQNALCVVHWHKQYSQCLVCPQSMQCNSRQLFRRSCFIVLLRWFLSRLRAENVRSEVADNTDIVKYIGKCVFRHQNVGEGELRRPPAPPPHLPYSAAYAVLSNFLCPDKVHARVIKDCLPVILGPLTKIINCSLLTSTFPAASKKAEVIPLKKGDDEVASNYRSLSFLAVASKICEKIALNQFSSYLTNNNRSSSHQSGNLLKLSVFILRMPYWKEWKTR